MPDLAASRERRWLILPVLCLSVFLVVVDNTIVNVALPTLSRHLGASITSLQWIVDAYSLAFAGLLLAGGGIGDRLGRKGTMQIGLIFFGLFSATAAEAHTTGSLITARVLMGVAAAFIFPASLAILTSLFSDPSERQKALGIWGSNLGHRRGLRPHHRGRTARALLVRLDLPGQRTHRDRDAGRRPVADPAPAPGHGPPVRRWRRLRLDGGRHGTGARHHRGTAVGMGGTRHRGLLCRRRRPPGPLHGARAAHDRTAPRCARLLHPPVHRGSALHLGGLLLPLRVHLPDHPVFPNS